MPKWEVVGGGDKGGILVREGKDLKSPQTKERLGTGSIVDQLELDGERLHYKLVSGSGQPEGWVSLTLSGKKLLEPKAAEVPKHPSDPETADAEWPGFLAAIHAGDPVETTLKAGAPWLGSVGKAPPKARVRLVIFNWTGNRGGAGSAHQFIKWPKMMKEYGCPEDTWEVVQVNYTGRGARMKEALMGDSAAVATAVADALEKAGTIPTVFFGFSFGAILAYEVATILAGKGKPVLGLAVASAEHPAWADRGKGQGPDGGATKDMSDEAFEEMLRGKGGTDVILNNPDSKKMYLPVILSDMVMEEAYGSAPPEHPALLCPIIVFKGAKCPQITKELAEGWLEKTKVTGSSKVEELDTGLEPGPMGPWLCDWYLCQGEPSAQAMTWFLATTFGGAPTG